MVFHYNKLQTEIFSVTDRFEANFKTSEVGQKYCP